MADFISERWQEKAGEESREAGRETKNKSRNIEVYLALAKTVDAATNPQIKILFADLGRAVLQYKRSVEVLTQAMSEKSKNDSLAYSDGFRAQAHNQLIDAVNALSDAFAADHLDTDWRSEIGFDRNEISNWSQSVAETVQKNIELKN